MPAVKYWNVCSGSLECGDCGASAPYRWVGIARQDCSYEPEPATPRSVMDANDAVTGVVSNTRYVGDEVRNWIVLAPLLPSWAHWPTIAVSQILGNPLDHSSFAVLSWLVVRIHWAGFGVRVSNMCEVRDVASVCPWMWAGMEHG